MQVNYLLIGHICKDLDQNNPAEYQLGGGVLYSGMAAGVLGAKVGILTSYPQDLEKDVLNHPVAGKFSIANLPSRFATTFRNIYKKQKRTQYLYKTAVPITATGVDRAGLSGASVRPSIIHLAPVAREIDESVFDKLKGDFTGATLQGWLRRRDLRDRVKFCAWREYEILLPKLDAAVLSEEDINSDLTLAGEYAKFSRTLVLTRGKKGCIVFSQGERKEIKPKKIIDIASTTGAGDVFAAGFFTRFFQLRDPFAAAEFANDLAAFHLERGIINL